MCHASHDTFHCSLISSSAGDSGVLLALCGAIASDTCLHLHDTLVSDSFVVHQLQLTHLVIVVLDDLHVPEFVLT